MCTALRSSSGLSFLDSINAIDCVESGGGFQDVELNGENPTDSFALGDFVQDGFGFQENIQHHELNNDTLEGNPMNGCFNEFPDEGQPSSMVKSVLLESVEQNNNPHGSAPHVSVESIVDFEKCSGGEGVERLEPSHVFPDSSTAFHPVRSSSPQPGVSLWKTMEDVNPSVMPVNDCSGNGKDLRALERIVNQDDKKISSCAENGTDSEDMLKSRHSSFKVSGSVTASRNDQADLSDSLLNISEVNDNICMDVGGRETLEKPCYDTVNSLLASSSKDVREDDKVNVKEPKTSVSDKCPSTSKDDCLAEFEIFLVNQSNSAQKKEGIPCSEANVPSATSVPGPLSAEQHHEVVRCVLNTEDPEIPCNDHVFFGKASAVPAVQKSCQEASHQVSTFADKNNSTRESSLMKSEDNLAQSSSASKMMRLDTLPKTNRQVIVESNDGESYAINKQANNGHIEPDLFRQSHVFPSIPMDDAIMEDPAHACNAKGTQMFEETAMETVLRLEENPTTSDLEQYDSEDDVPYFSDIEAMILDMDLSPEDSDSCIGREVAKYQPEDARRTIIRLEQCARASLQRTIASEGAFAVFYGRRLKHYIRDAEVMLGRTTEDVAVDIDLGREGHAGKISRRQALIKMEEDGSFHLKNLGKNSMFINGKEVVKGQRIGLSSCSLIEIREMSFIFEINHKAVKRFLANMDPKNKGKRIPNANGQKNGVQSIK